MPQYLPLPDGSFLPVKDGQNPREVWLKAMEAYPDAFGGGAAPEEAKDKTGFVPALESGIAGLKGSAALTAGKLGLMNQDAAQKYYEEQVQHGKDVFAPTTESWSQAPFTKVKELFGSSLPYMVAPLIGAAAAPEAAAVGALGLGAGEVGAGLASLGQFTGTNLARQVDENKSLQNASLGSAAAAALPQAALDVFALDMLPGVRSILGKAGIELTEQQAAQVAKQGLSQTLASYGGATLKAMGAEGLNEAAQQFFERLQAGLSINDPEARQEYYDNFLGGVVLGGVLAPVGHAFERSAAKIQQPAPVRQPTQQPGVQAPAAQQPAEEVPEPTLRQPAPEEVAEGPAAPTVLTKQQKAEAARQKKDQEEYLRKYAQQAENRQAAIAEYQRVKDMSPEEYALEQMQGVATVSKKVSPTVPQEDETGYYTQHPAPLAPHETYAAQQMALAKDRKAAPKLKDYRDYLMQDPKQAQALLENRTQIPGVTAKQSEALLGGIEMQLKARADAAAKAEAARVSIAQKRARSMFTQKPEDLLAAAKEQPGVQAQAAVKPEAEALQRIGQRPNPYLTANRDIENDRHNAELADKLVQTLPLADGRITPGDVYLGLGQKKQNYKDLQAQLAIARLTGNRALQGEIKRQLDATRPIPTEGGVGTEEGRQASETIARSKLPQLRVAESQADEFAADQRNTLLGMARLLASKKIMLPGRKDALLSNAKEEYVAQHAAEIEARRKAFGLPPMVNWERAEARARALEGLNTLTNNWGQFEDPAISVKALQNITREAVYQNLFKAVERKNLQHQTDLSEKLQPPKTGVRIAAPDELTLRPSPKETPVQKQAEPVDRNAALSETRPGATPEELQRTSAQPQMEMFPKNDVERVTQRATPANFQKMLDAKQTQKMREKARVEAAEKARQERVKAQEEKAAAQKAAQKAAVEKAKAEREAERNRREAVQRGREGLGLIGERVQRDNADIEKRAAQLRSAMGSLSDQIGKAKTEKRRANLQEKYDAKEEELNTLPEKAPQVRTYIKDRTDVDEAFEKEQIRLARQRNVKENLPSELPSARRGPVVRHVRTGRTEQTGQRKDVVGRADAVTNTLIARRAELAEFKRRVDFLTEKGKPVPQALTNELNAAQEKADAAAEIQKEISELEAKANQKLKESKARYGKDESENNRFARGVETTSPDLTVSQVKALEDNNIRQAMNDIAADGNTSKLNQVVAQRLAAMLDRTDVKVESSLKDEAGKSVLGMATRKLVQLNRNGGLSQEILLHEGTHAATERVIVQYKKDPTKLSEVQRVAVRELKALHAAIKNDPRITSASAKGDLSEFVAEVFSNRNLQEQLRNKKWRLSDAWKGFKSIIMRMLGVKDPETMLGAALQAVDALMVPSSDRTVGVKETAVSRRLSAKDIAALHTGSNSMQQFAESFGTTHIKQKDRTAEDANRIGQEYLDDMYANPKDYVAEADHLSYKVTMSDGKPYDADNPLHYVEAEAADFAMIEAQDDVALQKQEKKAVTAQRVKDLRALVRNMMNTPEFTYVEQALVAKAASKFAVLSDKNGRLKLVTIDPNNRHNVAVVGAADAGRVIEELRAGKPLKEAFLAGMQKNADANALKNKRKNGWQKFDQSESYEDVVALNAAAAGTPWCTGNSSLNYASSHLKGGDFYIYYKNGRPEVAVRMTGQNRIYEVRGNSPNQSVNAEQEQIARGFLQQNKFEGSEKYFKEFDNRRFLIDLFQGNTDYTLDALFNNPPQLAPNGKVADDAAKSMLQFRTLDGYGGRPAPTPAVVETIRARIQQGLDAAEAKGYYPNKSMRVSGYGADFEGTPVDLTTVKGVGSVNVSELAKKENGYVVMPDLEYANYIGTFTNLKLLNLKTVNKLVIFADETEKPIVVSTAKDTKINSVRSAEDGGGAVIIEGPERVDGIKLQDDYGSRSSLNVTLPDTKYVSIAAPSDFFERSIAYRARQIMQDAGMPADIDTEENFTKIYEGIHALANAISSDVSDIFENRLSDPELQGELDTPNAYYRAFAASILEHGGYEQARQGSPERQTAANKIAKKLNQAWDLEGSKKFGEKSGTLVAPKRVEETFTEETETPRYARAQATGFEDELGLAERIIADKPSMQQQIDANLGLNFRTKWLDRLAPLEKIAQTMMDPLKGTQMMFFLRMADQKMSFTQQAVANGVPQKVAIKRADGRTEYVIESQKGANLANIAKTLGKAPGMNPAAANRLFTLYLAGKRAERVGADVLNFDVSEQDLKNAVAKIEANKELHDVFEDARNQYNEYNRNLVNFLQDMGVISKETAASLSKSNDYIPYYRDRNGEAELVIGGEGTYRVGSLKDQPQLRELIGGNQKIFDFLTSSVQNTSMIMDMGLRNMATKNAMFELQSLGFASFYGGEASGPNVVQFRENGQDRYVRVDTDAAGIPSNLLVKSMEGIPVNNSALVRAMAMPATLLRRAVTISPLYSARQIFRDSVAAPLTSGADFTPVMAAIKQIGKMDTKGTLESRGIVGGQVFTGGNEDLTRILGEFQSGKIGLSQLVAKAEAVAMEADALTRRAQYDSYIRQGLSEMEATLMSLESMNFNRKGMSPSVRLASTLIPFFNAQLQSLDVLYRAMTGKMPMNERLDIQGKLYRRGAALACTAIAYTMLMQDDPLYKNAQPDEKYGNFFVHLPGTKEALRVPVPFEIGYIFKSIPEAIINSMASDAGAEDAYKAFKTIAIQTIPGATSGFMPAGVKPLVENATNHSFFTGRELESKAEQEREAQFRYRDSTSELAKGIGAITGTSPIKLENLIRGYTGTMGIAFTQAINAASPGNGVPKPTKKLSEMPVIGAAFQPEDAGGVVSDMYDHMARAREVQKTYNQLVKEGNGAEARQYLQENVNMLATKTMTGNLQETMGKLKKAEMAIKASSLTPDEKRARLDAIQKMRIQIASNVRGVYEKTTPR